MEQDLQTRDLRKHFEAILGRKIDATSNGEILLRDSIGLSSSETGVITSRDIGTTGLASKACVGGQVLLDVGGFTVTGLDGKAQFLLSDFHCHVNPTEDVSVSFPIILTATAQSQEPVFVTTRTLEVVPPNTTAPEDVCVEIYTWKPNGTPASSILVKWFCRLPIGLSIP